MKKIFFYSIVLEMLLSLSAMHSQTMTVQSKNGDKTYNIGDVSVITFGKTNQNSGIEMVLIPVGTFEMGQVGVATPVHTVNITQQFYMSKYEVTQRQFADVMGSNPSIFAGMDYNPVDNVSWNDAVLFCRQLTKKEGLEDCYSPQGSFYACDFTKTGYRLPTEAEWEYVCRAGTVWDYYTGSTEKDLAKAGWYSGNSNGSTYPVGQKQPNAFGIYDMSGNVFEWCWDWYGDYSADPVTNPPGPATGTYRVTRGGSWYYDASLCRSAARNLSNWWDRDYNLGFRIVRTK